MPNEGAAPVVSAEFTDQEAIAAIEALAADDFCAEAEMELAFRPETLTAKEKIMVEKLGRIYKIAHSYNRNNVCYHVHGDWRGSILAEIESKKAKDPSSKKTSILPFATWCPWIPRVS